MNDFRHEEIEVLASGAEPPHMHNDIELLYVLEGEAGIFYHNEHFRADAANVVVFNSGEIHGWTIFSDALLCRISIDYQEFRKAIGKKNFRIECNSVLDRGADFSQITLYVRAILKAYVDEDRGFRYKSLYYLLWGLIYKHFLQTGTTDISDDDKVIEGMIIYIREHYKEQLSLTELAKKWHMSASAFSRYFKKKAGLGFTEYVRSVRVEEAKRQLTMGNRAITEIAYDSGFTNISVFNKTFKEKTGVTPKVFRSESEKGRSAGKRQQAVRCIKGYLEGTGSDAEESREQDRVILDLSTPVKYLKGGLGGVVGKDLEALQERKLQEQVVWIASKLKLRYIKIYNVLKNVIEKGNRYPVSQMDFKEIDSVLDFLIDYNLKPFIELPLRQEKLIASIGTPMIRWDDPKEQKEQEKHWRFMLKSFLEHITERYSPNEVSEWKFEIWCSAEQQNGIQEYKTMYEDTYRLIRRYLPEAQIGGCNLNVTVAKESLREILLFWRSKKIIPDFLTIMSYPYSVKQNQEGKLVLCNVYPDTHYVRKDVEEYRTLLAELDYPKLPIYVSEWNTSLSERNTYNDCCAKACHLLTQMIDMAQMEVQSYYSNVSDLTSQYYDSPGSLIGASGLISKDGILKPAYYAMEFWSKLGNQCIGSGEHFVAARLNDGSIQILAFNGKSFNKEYYLQEESMILPQKLREIFKDTNRLDIVFELKNIQDRRYRMCTYHLREEEGSALAEWNRLGSTERLTREEISYLKKRCIPYMETKWLNVSDRQLQIELSLDYNEIVLISIR